MSFLDKDGVLSQAMFKKIGFLADIEIIADALYRFGEAVAGDRFDEEVESGGFEGIDSIVGISGDEDAGMDIHKTGAKLETA